MSCQEDVLFSVYRRRLSLLLNWILPSDLDGAQEFKMRPGRYVYDATCLPNTIFLVLASSAHISTRATWQFRRF